MANKTIPDYDAAGGIDAAVDEFLIWQNSTNTYRNITRDVILGTTGTPVDTNSVQTLSNKILNNTNTVTLKDNLFTLQDNNDITKQAQFDASGITTGITRTLLLPNVNDTLVARTSTDTLTNKTLTAPIISGGAIDNSNITVDSIAGHTSPTVVSVAGLSISAGVLNSANAVTTTSIANAAVTPAKWANTYKFRAYNTAAGNQGAGTTVVPLDTVNYDTNGNFNVTTFRYTAPVNGFYHFSGCVGCNVGAGDSYGTVLRKNGADVALGSTFVTYFAFVSYFPVTTDIQLVAGDYIELFFINGSGSNHARVNASQATFLSGHIISLT